jgi:homogentisate 1,2-dioxygenase
VSPTTHGWSIAQAAGGDRPLAKRHYRSQELPTPGGSAVDARVPLLFNGDVVVAVCTPDRPDPVYFTNADGDDLVFVKQGGGLLRTLLGDVCFDAGDYVFVPKGLLHRWISGLPWPSAGCTSNA